MNPFQEAELAYRRERIVRSFEAVSAGRRRREAREASRLARRSTAGAGTPDPGAPHGGNRRLIGWLRGPLHANR